MTSGVVALAAGAVLAPVLAAAAASTVRALGAAASAVDGIARATRDLDAVTAGVRSVRHELAAARDQAGAVADGMVRRQARQRAAEPTDSQGDTVGDLDRNDGRGRGATTPF